MRSRCVGRGAARFPPRKKYWRKRKQLELAQAVLKCALRRRGGAKGIRTPDLLNAIQTRYQLRYNPINFIFIIQETLPNWQAISTEKLKKISSFRSPTYLRTIKKERNMRSFHGGLSGTRTLGPLIKSQLLYQLS